MFYPVESRITALTTIRRERLLPVPGQVLVRSGELVGPADVVARCQLPGEIRVVDVSRTLGVPGDQAARYIRKSAGDTVQADEVLASPRGPLGQLQKSCRSPVEGQVVEVRGGLILIESAATTFELRAHLMGQVTNVMPNWGVVVSAAGSLIQAVWGSGGEAEGVLKMLVDNHQKPLRGRSIDVSCHGTVVAGGRILDEKVFEQAVEAKIRGMIIGAVHADLCPFLESLPFPVLATEGFGTIPMSQQVFSLLQSNAGREVMLSADTRAHWGAKRPEVLIPLRAEGEIPAEETQGRPLEVGDKVRALRAPYLGAMGTVASLPDRPHAVESGAQMAVAEVHLEDGEHVFIPLFNLESIR